jgi:hypothetical protein
MAKLATASFAVPKEHRGVFALQHGLPVRHRAAMFMNNPG